LVGLRGRWAGIPKLDRLAIPEEMPPCHFQLEVFLCWNKKPPPPPGRSVRSRSSSTTAGRFTSATRGGGTSTTTGRHPAAHNSQTCSISGLDGTIWVEGGCSQANGGGEGAGRLAGLPPGDVANRSSLLCPVLGISHWTGGPSHRNVQR
jgi:hypothetical protein